MTKYPIAIRLGGQTCQNYLLLHSAFPFSLECSVFPIRSLDVCFKDEANKKDQMRENADERPRNISHVELEAWLVLAFFQ